MKKKFSRQKNISKVEVRTNEIWAASPFAGPTTTFLVITSFLLDVKKNFKEKRNISKGEIRTNDIGAASPVAGPNTNFFVITSLLCNHYMLKKN